MVTMMTVHATTDAGVAYGERFGLYQALGTKPQSARDLAGRTGLPLAQVSHWLTAQEAGGYLVRDRFTGLYRAWCEITERVSSALTQGVQN